MFLTIGPPPEAIHLSKLRSKGLQGSDGTTPTLVIHLEMSELSLSSESKTSNIVANPESH